MNAATQVQNPPRTTPTVVLWLMAAVVMGGAELLAGVPATPPAAMAMAAMAQLEASAASRVAATAVLAQAGAARSKTSAPWTTDSFDVAAFQSP